MRCCRTATKLLTDFAASNSDVLAATDLGGPGLREEDAVDFHYDRPRLQVNSIEIVKQADRLAAFYVDTTVEERLVMSGEGRDDVARAINDLDFPLRPARWWAIGSIWPCNWPWLMAAARMPCRP